MQAKLVNEAIKHLSPKSEEEVNLGYEQEDLQFQKELKKVGAKLDWKQIRDPKEILSYRHYPNAWTAEYKGFKFKFYSYGIILVIVLDNKVEGKIQQPVKKPKGTPNLYAAYLLGAEEEISRFFDVR